MPNRTYHPSRQLVHGFRCKAHPLYQTWANMLSRCFNKNSPSFTNYGDRGITVDERWYHFANFAHDMYPSFKEGLTLERKDVNRGYVKDNCCWASHTEQCVNRRRFRNNKSGQTGVKQLGEREFYATFQHEHTVHSIGRFVTYEKAVEARTEFVRLFYSDREKALAMIVEKEKVLWNTSTTKRRGVTPHADAGFIARCTIDGVRHYIGYFKTIEEACDARDRYIKKQTQGARV